MGRRETLGEALRRWSFYCKSSLPTPFSHQALLSLSALLALVLKLTERVNAGGGGGWEEGGVRGGFVSTS